MFVITYLFPFVYHFFSDLLNGSRSNSLHTRGRCLQRVSNNSINEHSNAFCMQVNMCFDWLLGDVNSSIDGRKQINDVASL